MSITHTFITTISDEQQREGDGEQLSDAVALLKYDLKYQKE